MYMHCCYTYHDRLYENRDEMFCDPLPSFSLDCSGQSGRVKVSEKLIFHVFVRSHADYDMIVRDASSKSRTVAAFTLFRGTRILIHHLGQQQ